MFRVQFRAPFGRAAKKLVILAGVAVSALMISGCGGGGGGSTPDREIQVVVQAPTVVAAGFSVVAPTGPRDPLSVTTSGVKSSATVTVVCSGTTQVSNSPLKANATTSVLAPSGGWATGSCAATVTVDGASLAPSTFDVKAAVATYGEMVIAVTGVYPLRVIHNADNSFSVSYATNKTPWADIGCREYYKDKQADGTILFRCIVDWATDGKQVVVYNPETNVLTTHTGAMPTTDESKWQEPYQDFSTKTTYGELFAPASETLSVKFADGVVKVVRQGDLSKMDNADVIENLFTINNP